MADRKRDRSPPGELYEVFDADFERGRLYWRVRPVEHFRNERYWKAVTGRTANKEIVPNAGDRYYRVKWTRADIGIKERAFVHHVLWAMYYGRWPEDEIDHINGDPRDNSIKNLREVTRLQNRANSIGQKNSRLLGYKGVYKNIGCRGYMARLAGVYLGSFETPDEAQQAYLEAASQRYGEFACGGRRNRD